jgi:hypothetical protein
MSGKTVALLAVAFFLSSCSVGATSPQPLPWLTWSPTSLTIVDQLQKGSAEDGEQVVAILIRGQVAIGAQVVFVPQRTFVRRGGLCGPYPPVPKALDRLHPDAVQPAAQVLEEPTSDRFIVSPSASTNVEGWLSWQVALPPTSCAYQFSVSPYLDDAIIADGTVHTRPPNGVSGQAEFEIDPK